MTLRAALTRELGRDSSSRDLREPLDAGVGLRGERLLRLDRRPGRADARRFLRSSKPAAGSATSGTTTARSRPRSACLARGPHPRLVRRACAGRSRASSRCPRAYRGENRDSNIDTSTPTPTGSTSRSSGTCSARRHDERRAVGRLAARARRCRPRPRCRAPYRVGPGDVIEVVVDGRPDLSRMPTVQTTGSIWLPRAGDVEVRGLTTGEIAARITPKLAGSDLAGAARGGARHRVLQPVRLGAGRRATGPAASRCAPARAWSTRCSTPAASCRAPRARWWSRAATASFADGAHELRDPVRRQGPEPRGARAPGAAARRGRRGHGGAAAATSGVSGAVQHPGQYAYEKALTLGALVEQAGGVLRSGSDRVVLRRAGVRAGGRPRRRSQGQAHPTWRSSPATRSW